MMPPALQRLFYDIAETPWLYVPAGAVFLFAGVLHFLLRRRGAGAHRRALLFGVGIVAALATIVFAAFGLSFVRLVSRDSASFDIVWIVGAVAAASLAAWLWFRFYRLVRQT